MGDDEPTAEPRRSFWYAVLVGVGVMAAVDEVLFHQVLQWHHFFDRATPTIGILSDGLLHAAELIAIVGGFFLLIGLARSRQLAVRWAWAGFFVGLGGFQLFDGIVDHKILRTHQVRYGVDLLMYDLAWNIAGGVLIGVGGWLCVRARAADRREARL